MEGHISHADLWACLQLIHSAPMGVAPNSLVLSQALQGLLMSPQFCDSQPEYISQTMRHTWRTKVRYLSKARDWFPKVNGNHRWWKTVGWPRLHNCTPSFCASPRLDSWELSFSFRSPGTSSPSNAYSTQTHWKPTKGWKAGKLQDKHSGKRVLGEQYTEPVLSDALPQSLEK